MWPKADGVLVLGAKQPGEARSMTARFQTRLQDQMSTQAFVLSVHQSLSQLADWTHLSRLLTLPVQFLKVQQGQTLLQCNKLLLSTLAILRLVVTSPYQNVRSLLRSVMAQAERIELTRRKLLQLPSALARLLTIRSVQGPCGYLSLMGRIRTGRLLEQCSPLGGR